MKECNRCHIVKEDNEFAFRNKIKGTFLRVPTIYNTPLVEFGRHS